MSKAERGKPYVMKTVLDAENLIVDKRLSKEHEDDIGSEFFRDVSFRLAVGDELKDRRHVTVQVRRRKHRAMKQ